MSISTIQAKPLTAENLIAWAELAAPREACGLCFAARQDSALQRDESAAQPLEYFITRCVNSAMDPRRSYRIDPLEWLEHERCMLELGLRVCGVWHSHPCSSAHASRADAATRADLGHPPGWIFPIVSLTPDAAVLVHTADTTRRLKA